MRLHILLPLALGLVAFIAPADEIVFAPASKTTLHKSFKAEGKLESQSMKTTVDGDEQPSGDVKITITDMSKLEVTDEYVKVGKGRPLELNRTYDKLESKSSQKVSGEGVPDGQEATKEKSSKLEGKTVVIKWDDAKEEYKLTFDGDKGDADLLEGLAEDLDLRAFLPKESVSSVPSWDLDPKAFAILMSPGGNLHLEATEGEKEEDAASAKLDRELAENLTGKAKATYKGTREVDGKKCGVIEIHGELKTHASAEAKTTIEIHSDLEVQGELLWNLAGSHAWKLNLEGTNKSSVKVMVDFDAGGETHKVHNEIELEGTTTFEARFGDAK
jgi:hypothetical protein